jgi:cytochrome b pre-mRNA-processing protein 6
MSAKETAKVLVKVLENFPKEKLTDLSFREAQLDRFRPVAGIKNPEKNTGKSLADIVGQVNPYKIKELDVKSDENFSEESLLHQIQSLKTIQSNQYRDYYYTTDKLLRPQGNPTYYERLVAEINGEGKENFITGMRTVILGK